MRPIFVNRPMGPLMVGVVVLVAIMLIFSTVAFQDWKDVVRRDDEAEMIFRAREIVRALRRYQQDRGTLPTDLELLMEPGSKGQYFIRRMYDDPLVKDGVWGLLHAAPGGGVFDPHAPTPTAGAEGDSFLKQQTSPGAQSMVSGIGDPGQGAQGLPIAGVKTLCTETPFRHYNDQSDYRLWLFTVFEQREMAPGTGMGQPGQQQQGNRPPNQPPRPPRR